MSWGRIYRISIIVPGYQRYSEIAFSRHAVKCSHLEFAESDWQKQSSIRVFKKVVIKICGKFTGERPCQSAVSNWTPLKDCFCVDCFFKNLFEWEVANIVSTLVLKCFTYVKTSFSWQKKCTVYNLLFQKRFDCDTGTFLLIQDRYCLKYGIFWRTILPAAIYKRVNFRGDIQRSNHTGGNSLNGS